MKEELEQIKQTKLKAEERIASKASSRVSSLMGVELQNTNEKQMQL